MATRIRITQDDESDDDSPERKFIWEICSVATTVSRRLTSGNTNKDSTKIRDSTYICDHESCTKTDRIEQLWPSQK